MGSFGPRTPNASVSRLHAAARKARLAAARAIATHTNEEWVALVAACGGRCVKCGAADRLQKDHIVLIARGGSDGIDNLQPLCRRCNCAKSLDQTDRRPPDWRVAMEALHG